MKKIKKIVKIFLLLFLILTTVLYLLFYFVTAPKSDEKVIEEYLNLGTKVNLLHQKYQTFDFRKIEVQKVTSFPTIIFVHGTIGSVLDFKKYISDSLLSARANFITYDRIGYNYKDKNPVQESIAFETEMLEFIMDTVPTEKLILVGYSYGGPIVLASQKKVRKTILIAPAVYGKVEPMPGALGLYKSKLTRWLIPSIWQEASKEKLSHPKNLEEFETKWNHNPNQIISIHGDSDWIVPYDNSKYLTTLFSKEQLELVTLPKANHDLIWSRFKEIKNLLLKELN